MYKGTCDPKMLMLWLAAPYGWQPCQLPELLLCFYYCIDVTFCHTYACTHNNSNVIPALSAFQSDKDRQCLMMVSSWWCTSDGGVVIFRGGLGQLHRFGKRTQLIHAPRV